MSIKVDRRRLKKSLDAVILSFLSKKAMDSKDIPELIYKKFRRYFSYSTINEVLVSLEKGKMIKSMAIGNKKAYFITKIGKDVIKKTGKVLKELGI